LPRMRVLPTRNRATKPKQHETSRATSLEERGVLPAKKDNQLPSHPTLTSSRIGKTNKDHSTPHDDILLDREREKKTQVSSSPGLSRAEPTHDVAINDTIRSVKAFDEEDSNRWRKSVDASANSTLGRLTVSSADSDGTCSSEYFTEVDDGDNSSMSEESNGEEDQTVLIDSATARQRKVDESWFSEFRMVLPTVVMPSFPQEKQEDHPEPDKTTISSAQDPTLLDNGIRVGSEEPQLPHHEIGLDEYQTRRRADCRRKWFRLLNLQRLSMKRSLTAMKRRNEPKTTIHFAVKDVAGKEKGLSRDHRNDDVIRHHDDVDVAMIRSVEGDLIVDRNQKHPWRPIKALQHVGVSVKRRLHGRSGHYFPSEDDSSRSFYSGEKGDYDDYDSLSAYSWALTYPPRARNYNDDDDEDDTWVYLMSFFNPNSY
jgi:hypothetical protein